MTKQEAARLAARRLFATKDGETVLKFLEDLFYHNNFKDNALERQVGRRDVIQEIHHLMRQTND